MAEYTFIEQGREVARLNLFPHRQFTHISNVDIAYELKANVFPNSTIYVKVFNQ